MSRPDPSVDRLVKALDRLSLAIERKRTGVRKVIGRSSQKQSGYWASLVRAGRLAKRESLPGLRHPCCARPGKANKFGISFCHIVPHCATASLHCQKQRCIAMALNLSMAAGGQDPTEGEHDSGFCHYEATRGSPGSYSRRSLEEEMVMEWILRGDGSELLLGPFKTFQVPLWITGDVADLVIAEELASTMVLDMSFPGVAGLLR